LVDPRPNRRLSLGASTRACHRAAEAGENGTTGDTTAILISNALLLDSRVELGDAIFDLLLAVDAFL
jgi:hypothetical protein